VANFRFLRTVRSAVALSLAAGLSSCSFANVNSVIPAASGFTAPPKPSTCNVDFFWTTPDRPYQELAAVLLGVTGTPGSTERQKAFRLKACELGGDAVIVRRPFDSTEGIVVKYREGP
jgi:hypothetical protein